MVSEYESKNAIAIEMYFKVLKRYQNFTALSDSTLAIIGKDYASLKIKP